MKYTVRSYIGNRDEGTVEVEADSYDEDFASELLEALQLDEEDYDEGLSVDVFPDGGVLVNEGIDLTLYVLSPI